jgi:cytolysin (calcineurin-like family phosphatase)
MSFGPHWWSKAEREALLRAIKGDNVIGLFHGHQHETAMIYRADGLDLVKPKAAYMGGFAVARVSEQALDVVLAEVTSDDGDIAFTSAFSKEIDTRKVRSPVSRGRIQRSI